MRCPAPGGIPRQQKIARFKRERQIRKEISDMSKRQVDADEEHERSLWCLELEGAFLKALAEIDMIHQEIEILDYSAQQKKAAAAADVKPQDDAGREKLTSAMRLLADDIQKREALRKQVAQR